MLPIRGNHPELFNKFMENIDNKILVAEKGREHVA